MKLSGKVVGKKIKQYGKGNGAESMEVGELTVKFTGDIKGHMVIEPPDDEFDRRDLGDTTSFDVPFHQEKLDLNGRNSKRARDQKPAAANAH